MPSCGQCRSCVPQPSSAGCSDSPTNAPLDQVLTNSPHCLRALAHLAVALGDLDDLDAETPARAAPTLPCSPAAVAARPVSLARLSSACLTRCETRPGVGAVHQHARPGPADTCLRIASAASRKA